MKNDRERKEFVDNPKNWEPLGETNGIRLTELTYKEHHWYRIEIWQVKHEGYDFEKHDHKLGRAWVPVHIYKMDEDLHAYTYSMTAGDVAKEIKEIDREEKQK